MSVRARLKAAAERTPLPVESRPSPSPPVCTAGPATRSNLGFTAIHVGLAGATRNGWMLATCPVSAALVHRWVLREERWLHQRFGESYDAYRARVPRYM